MTHELDLGSGSTGNVDTTVTIPSRGVSVGETVVVGVAVIQSAVLTNPSSTITDSKGNEYVWLPTAHLDSFTGGIILAYSVITTALIENDTITFHPGGSNSRTAMTVQVFSDEVTSRGTSGTEKAEASNINLTVGDLSSTTTDTLYVVVWNLINSARTFTPGSGWTGGEKRLSTGGSGDRAVVVQWKYSSSPGTTTTPASLNSGGNWVGVGVGLGLDELPPPGEGGVGTTIVGGMKRPVTSTSVIVGGMKRPVTSTSVIVGGMKRPIV